MATSCIGVNYPTVAFRCNPRQSDNCPDTHSCCSDDPASENGRLPNFTGKNIPDSATPFFAGQNNKLGTRGMCVRTDDIPMGSGLLDPGAVNCPIPCNPTWSGTQIQQVCGDTRVCCQTVELEPEDCIQVDGVFRPANGGDIEAGRSTWNQTAHETHQDPNGTGCLQFAMGAMNNTFFDCVAQLSVANQRGFCMSLGMNQQCPTMQPGYIDACTAQNGGGGATAVTTTPVTTMDGSGSGGGGSSGTM